MIKPSDYYKRGNVLSELVDFLKGRWVAVHCTRKMKDGRNILIRYSGKKPLTVNKVEDVISIIKRFRYLGPRTFYGTASIYRSLETKEHALDYENNIVMRTPTWDIDSKPEWWETTIKIGKVIVEEIMREGVKESIWLKWSGRGLHIHIHEKAISPKVYAKYKPIDVSWAIVDYIISKTTMKIDMINSRNATSIKVENLMDPQRVFTAPLSLHRYLDVVCVPFKLEDLDSFSWSWTDPNKPTYNPRWRTYIEGEADKLALKALKYKGGYPLPILARARRRKKTLQIEEAIRKFAPPPLPLEEDFPIRFNPHPLDISKIKVSKSPREALRLLEDTLSSYVLGIIEYDTALKILEYNLQITIPMQAYKPDEKNKVITIYSKAIKMLKQLKTRENVRNWLLSLGERREEPDINKYFI